MPHRKFFVRRVSQFVANDVHVHHHWPESAPPDDPDVSQQCPQCRRLTWRFTAHCMHCRLDLRAWRARTRLLATWRKLVSPLARLRW